MTDIRVLWPFLLPNTCRAVRAKSRYFGELVEQSRRCCLSSFGWLLLPFSPPHSATYTDIAARRLPVSGRTNNWALSLHSALWDPLDDPGLPILSIVPIQSTFPRFKTCQCSLENRESPVVWLTDLCPPQSWSPYLSSCPFLSALHLSSVYRKQLCRVPSWRFFLGSIYHPKFIPSML